LKLPSGKASGPDCIPNEILALVASRRPQICLRIFNRCLKDEGFSAPWKVARLVLLYKGSSNFRPLSLPDGAGKIFKRLILQRLYAYIDESGSLSANQFGFRSRRFTVDAIEKLLELADYAASGSTKDRHLCAVTALDVTNEFNSALWPLVDAALRPKTVPLTMVRLYTFLNGRMCFDSGRAYG